MKITILQRTSILLVAFLFFGAFGSTVLAQEPYVYHNNVTLESDLRQLVDDHPNLAKLSSIGKSVQGLDIWCIEITNFDITCEKPVIYIDGSHHGNEQLSTELCYVFISYLLEEYETNASARELVDTKHFYITPIINVDGNMRDTRWNARMVDINRNYPFHWTGDGDMLGLSSPESEPEIQANMAIIEKLVPDLYVTFHTGVTIFIYPWGWTSDSPPDEKVYERLGDDIWNATGLDYGQISTALYIAPGTSLDWAYNEFGTISYCMEVDDEQWVPLSLEHIRERLWQSFWGLEYSCLNAEYLGAKIEIKEPTVEVGNDGHATLSFLLENVGWGDGANLTLDVSRGDGSEYEGDLSWIPNHLDSGGRFRVSIGIDGENTPYDIDVLVGYNRTMCNGRYVTENHLFEIDYAGGAPEICYNGDTVEAFDAESNSVPSAGVLCALASFGIASLVLTLRRR